jgi:hypothetical protein
MRPVEFVLGLGGTEDNLGGRSSSDEAHSEFKRRKDYRYARCSEHRSPLEVRLREVDWRADIRICLMPSNAHDRASSRK